jgi:hypothetical protein
MGVDASSSLSYLPLQHDFFPVLKQSYPLRFLYKRCPLTQFGNQFTYFNTQNNTLCIVLINDGSDWRLICEFMGLFHQRVQNSV